MNRIDIQTKISTLLKNAPEKALQQVLEYLEQVNGKSNSEIDLSKNLSKILQEDKDLLKRLAQ